MTTIRGHGMNDRLYSHDRAWYYQRPFGWLPTPGYQPLPPRPDRAIRFMRLLPDIRERM